MKSAIIENYLSGFGNDFETEAVKGALPHGQNSPQKCNFGLYAEQLSGSPFTAPRSTNERSWLYRLLPSVAHSGSFTLSNINPFWLSAPIKDEYLIPLAQYRWSAPEYPSTDCNFIEGVRTATVAGDMFSHSGMSSSWYFITRSMENEFFYTADGELLFVPQEGEIQIFTEFGKIDLTPCEIAVVPRGVKFKIILKTQKARGYLCENYGGKFTLPNRGPIGANCLANPRDFKTPVAAFEDKQIESKLYVKWGGRFHETTLPHSPLDVVAWHGNYAPYKYDLRTFSPVGAILFDHPDPSIFTVLTSPTGEEGTANIDFVIFPERWLVAENSFRPPWYHKNIMSEFMGLIYGKYDAKPTGFTPGGASLHNCMIPHGPDKEAFEKATTVELKPEKLTSTMAFMFETKYAQIVSKWAGQEKSLQQDYWECWKGFKRAKI
jgi:homogentisate 1,2-dioxygenase